MKIQITDRKLWLDKVLTANENIIAYRIAEDLRMDALPWYKQIFLSSWEYPCQTGWWQKYDIDNIEKALLSDGTGDVYVSSGELRSLEVWL